MRKIVEVFALLIMLVSFFSIGYHCGRSNASVPSGDTIRNNDTIWMPEPPIFKEVPVAVPQEVDTAAILAMYYTRRIYEDTLVDNARLTFVLTDTIFNNRLSGRTVIYNIRSPTPSKALTLGLDAGFRQLNFKLGYRKNRSEYSLGYDFINKGLVFGYKFDIYRW